MLQKYWKFPNRNVQTFRFIYHDTNGQNHGPVWKIQSFLLNEICTVILWQDCYGKGNLRKSFWSTVGRRFPFGNAYSYTVKKGYSYLCMCVKENWLERNKTLIRCGKYSTKKLFWENQHLSLIMYTWCVLKDNEVSKVINDSCRTMFESRISAGAIEKLPCSENLRISSWSYDDMEDHAKKCVERYCELANKTTQQLYKVFTPSIDDHHFTEEELKSVGELLKVCSQIVLKCLYLARIGRPDILWSVTKLARSITKWTKACDKRISRLISYIHHTCEYTQYCHVGNTAKQCRLGLFHDTNFAGYLEDSKSTSGWTLCIFGSHTFVPISWMCKKQTSVSHSSTESEIISLDAGWRLDGIPALDLWDLIVAVLHGNTYQSNQARGDLCTNQREVRAVPHTKTKEISWNDRWSGQCWFYFFERQFFSSGSFVVCVWRQRSTDQDDHKGKKPDNDMFPEPQELLLIGCSIESILTPKSKSNTLTPNTNSQTYWPREISHVMNGIIFCVCSTLAFSVLPIVLKWCRKERKKMQVKKESQQNQSRWWIWSRDAA